MSEKVLHEVQIVETDDGFRIELKGDKEMLRQMLFPEGRPFFMPFGGGRRFGGHGPFGRHHHEHPDQEPEACHEPWRPPFGRAEREKRKLRRFAGRWEARWGYDLGPWWDETSAPPEAESGEEPSADV